MLSGHCNNCIKSLRNWKKSLKNIKIKSFIDKHSWEGINYPSGKDDWKKFDRNNLTLIKKRIDVKRILKNHLQYKHMNIPQQVFQGLLSFKA